MNKTKSRYHAARKAMLFWCLFIGVGALFGGAAMLLRPNGSLLRMQDVQVGTSIPYNYKKSIF